MNTMTTSRLDTIQTKAEDLAMSLVRDGLSSTDPKLASLCQRLTRFKPLLPKDVDDQQARQLLRNGFRVVNLKLDPGASDEAEVMRLLSELVDKLGGMFGR
jgi:hypothetical protein